MFCKQKTAYEMRISDWSSDVCSSDLSNVLCEPEASELPALMWIKEIAIGCPHVPPWRSAASALQYEMPRHELAIIFADRAIRRTQARIGSIISAGTFPYIDEPLATYFGYLDGERGQCSAVVRRLSVHGIQDTSAWSAH